MTPGPASSQMMTRISQYVFICEPRDPYTALSVKASGPKLVLLSAWMDARDAHIAKYIAHYQFIYPNATIILLKFVMKESLLEPVASNAVQPAVTYLCSLIRAGDLSANPERPEILAHVFSNGGATSMQNVYVSYQRLVGQPFPLHATVFDSCPGLYDLSTSYNALMTGFPPGPIRFIAVPFIVFMIITAWIWHSCFSFIAGEDFLSKNARVLNDRNLVKQTNRTYIYGKTDIMVDWRHIAKHARSAVSKGFDVRRESFDDSPHVTHMRTDTKRYWLIVQETWKKAVTS